MRVVLASKSPRRKELMNLLNIDYEIIVSSSEERMNEKLNIYDQSKELAYDKAKNVFDTLEGDRIVIGSDTIVVKNNKIYGKPISREDAFNMIKELQNDIHEVITSVSVLIEKDGQIKEYVDLDITKVHVKEMSDKEIDNWINTGNALDKAGAYGIQSEFAIHIDKIEGNYHSVVGLPIHKVYEILKKENIL